MNNNTQGTDMDTSKPCRNVLLRVGYGAVPKSCPRCGLAKECPMGHAARGEQPTVTQHAAPEAPTSDDEFIKNTLTELAKRGASAAGLSLAAQLLGAGACDGCGYRKLHCRCIDPAPLASPVAAPEAPAEWTETKVLVLRNEVAIILGCQDGRSAEEKAEAAISWIAKHGPAPEAPASEQQALRDGYQGSTMVSDFQGPKITLRYATSAQADAAHAVLCKMIDASLGAATASTQDDLEEALACALSEHTNLSTDGIDNCVPRLVATIPAAALPFDIVPTEGIDPVLYERATTASQSDADKMLAMRAEYNRQDGAARGMLMGRATTASASALTEKDRLNIKVAMVHLKEAKFHTASDNLRAIFDQAALAGADTERDAARWRAFVGSARIKMQGSAGLNASMPNNYAHMGLEIWTTFDRNYSQKLLDQMDSDNALGREWLTKYADIAIEAQRAAMSAATEKEPRNG